MLALIFITIYLSPLVRSSLLLSINEHSEVSHSGAIFSIEAFISSTDRVFDVEASFFQSHNILLASFPDAKHTPPPIWYCVDYHYAPNY